MPGFLGYYNRGFINPLVVGGTISLLALSADELAPPFWFPLAIMFLVFFWLYNIIDAFRRRPRAAGFLRRIPLEVG